MRWLIESMSVLEKPQAPGKDVWACKANWANPQFTSLLGDKPGLEMMCCTDPWETGGAGCLRSSALPCAGMHKQSGSKCGCSGVPGGSLCTSPLQANEAQRAKMQALGVPASSWDLGLCFRSRPASQCLAASGGCHHDASMLHWCWSLLLMLHIFLTSLPLFLRIPILHWMGASAPLWGQLSRCRSLRSRDLL